MIRENKEPLPDGRGSEEAGRPGHSAAVARRPTVWTHRLAWVTLVVAFLMICAGASVTSYQAGMAVPDWPTTFGYNPLLYPPGDWLAARDVFLEHGRRLLGILLGALAFVLAGLLWKTEKRPPIRWLGLAAVVGYCVQELFGGLRVLNDEILWAKFQDCTAPLFLAVVAAITSVTSPAWQSVRRLNGGTAARRLRRWTSATVATTYLQITLGAQLRHLPPDTPTGWFVLWVWLHLIAAAMLAIMVLAMGIAVGRRFSEQPGLRRRAWWLAALVVVQLALGATVWVTNFGWPVWFTDLVWTPDYTVVAEGRLQVLAMTAHVAVGSLSLVAALSLALWCRRLVDSGESLGTPAPGKPGR